MARGVEHRIEDYDRPRLGWPLRAANAVGGPVARRLLRFDEQELHELASKQCGGLDDFGPPGYREPLGVLLQALECEAGLSPLGRFTNRELVIGLLANRLKLFELLRRHPEIREERIERPIIIAGLPRTGTTHLHNLLAQAPGLRSLPYYESLEPVLLPDEQPAPGQPDPRIARCQRGLDFQHRVMPLFPAMHEMTPQSVHEEIQLLAMDFSTMLFETSTLLPGYAEWYRGTDQTGAYRFLHLVLQALQWLRGPRRWVLKSPQHLEQIGPLLRVFPDAFFVQTHRDPVRILTSLCTMICYSQRIAVRRPDSRRIARYWVERGSDLLRASIEQRGLLPAERRFDVDFADFMQDDVAMVQRVLDFAGHPLDEQGLQAMRVFMDAHPRGRHGTIRYDLGDFGIDAARLREQLGFYGEHFDVADL